MRPISLECLSVLRAREGLRLQAYPDPESPRGLHKAKTGKDDPKLKGDPWTIGYGHTGPEVKDGLRWTLEDAERAFLTDVERHAKGIDPKIRVPLTADQWNALVCLAFNIGIAGFNGSTLLRLLNEGNIVAAANEFLVWKYSGGHVSENLLKRRKLERELFLRGFGATGVV